MRGRRIADPARSRANGASLRPVHAEASRDGNLGEHGQDLRLRGGVILGALSLILGVVLLKLGVPTALRAVLFVPCTSAASMVFMGLYGT